jgi:hypothetical protein
MCNGNHQKTNQPQKYTEGLRIEYIGKDKNKLTTPACRQAGKKDMEKHRRIYSM